ASLSQVMIAMGGNVQNHLLAAFFGDVLTTPVEELFHLWPTILFGGIGFAFVYRNLLSISLDRDQAVLAGVPVRIVEALFFLLLCVISAQAINLMGSFYTLTQMIVPGLFALAVARSVPVAL